MITKFEIANDFSIEDSIQLKLPSLNKIFSTRSNAIENRRWQKIFLQLLEYPESFDQIVPADNYSDLIKIKTLLTKKNSNNEIFDELLSIILSFSYKNQKNYGCTFYLKNFLNTACSCCREVICNFLRDSFGISVEKTKTPLSCVSCLLSFGEFITDYHLSKINLEHLFMLENNVLSQIVVKTTSKYLKIKDVHPKKLFEFFNIIENSDIRVLDLSKTNLSVLDEETLKAIASFCLREKIQKLILDSTKIYELTLTQLEHLLAICKSPFLQRLSLQENYLATTEDASWDILCEIFSLPNLQELNLSDNELEGLGLSRWKTLKTSLTSSLKTLILCDNYVDELEDECWPEFCDLLSGNLQHINLDNCNLFKTPKDKLVFLMEKLKLTKLDCLNIAFNNGMNCMEEEPINPETMREYWSDVIRSMHKLPITVLNLNGCFLADFMFPWNLFGEMLETTELDAIYLSHNSLSSLGKFSEWNSFCTAIGHLHLDYLDLSENSLGELQNKDYWIMFGKMLVSSRLEGLCLAKNKLNLLEPLSWQAFCDALKNSFVIELDIAENDLSTEQVQQINSILEKNKKKSFLSLQTGLKSLVAFTFWELPEPKIDLNQKTGEIKCTSGVKRKFVPDAVIESLQEYKRACIRKA